MAERDQIGNALGRHDAGRPGHPEHIALGELAGADRRQRRRLHPEGRSRDRLAHRLGLGGDIDHPGVPGRREVREAAESRHLTGAGHRSYAGDEPRQACIVARA